MAQQRDEQDVDSLLEADHAGLRFVCYGNTHTHTRASHHLQEATSHFLLLFMSPITAVTDAISAV